MENTLPDITRVHVADTTSTEDNATADKSSSAAAASHSHSHQENRDRHDAQLRLLESILVIHAEANTEAEREGNSEQQHAQPRQKTYDRIDIAALRKCIKDIVLTHNDGNEQRIVKQDGGGDRLAAYRAIVWRVLLGVIPTPSRLWKRELEKKRTQYADFLDDFNFCDPTTSTSSDAKDDTLNVRSKGQGEKSDAVTIGDGEIVLQPTPSPSPIDHPLCDDENSEWKSYFEDYELMKQIESDVDRTHPDLPFFSDEHSPTCAKSPRAAMRRMLFVYAKLNPGLKYVQGMNELLAPIIYCYWETGLRKTQDMIAHSTSLQKLYTLYRLDECAEQDAFFSLLELLSEFRDFYCKQLDNSNVGIRAALANLSEALAKYDPRLYHYLEKEICISAQFYAFRWITLLFTQEFGFSDILILWDYLLADDRVRDTCDSIILLPNYSIHGRIECIIDMGCAMLLLVRDEILRSDFATNMKRLQNYPKTISIRKIMILTERLKGMSNVKSNVANIVNGILLEMNRVEIKTL